MRIILCDASDHALIAYEEREGSREGDFFLDAEGVVRYAHPGDGHVWFAAPDPTSFRRAVEHWIVYLDRGSKAQADGRGATPASEGDSRTRVLPPGSGVAFLPGVEPRLPITLANRSYGAPMCRPCRIRPRPNLPAV